MVQDRAILKMDEERSIERRYYINDNERPQTQISRSCHHLTLNISETVRDTDVVTAIVLGTYVLLKHVISNEIPRDASCH